MKNCVIFLCSRWPVSACSEEGRCDWARRWKRGRKCYVRRMGWRPVWEDKNQGMLPCGECVCAACNKTTNFRYFSKWTVLHHYSVVKLQTVGLILYINMIEAVCLKCFQPDAQVLFQTVLQLHDGWAWFSTCSFPLLSVMTVIWFTKVWVPNSTSVRV